jgi:protein gp37
MATETKIEWADGTFNPWIGCTKVSPACDHCYAEVATPSRTMGVEWGVGKPRYRTSASNWRQPLTWNRDDGIKFRAWEGIKEQHPELTDEQLVAAGFIKPRRRRVFCASLADVFDNEVDPQWREDLFALIQATPNLDWLLLTKRIGNVPAMVAVIPGWLPPNVWLGATICNQAEADRDIPKLLRVPAAVRFLSIEPMLGPVDLRWAFPDIRTACCHLCGFRTNAVGGTCPNDGETLRGDVGIDWVIAGGESGSHARPSHPDWFRSLRDQCAAAGVPFLFKQWGEWEPREEWSGHQGGGRFERQTAIMLDGSPCSHDGVPQDVGAHRMAWVGKKAAGRTLDGRTHTEFPK